MSKRSETIRILWIGRNHTCTIQNASQLCENAHHQFRSGVAALLTGNNSSSAKIVDTSTGIVKVIKTLHKLARSFPFQNARLVFLRVDMIQGNYSI